MTKKINRSHLVIGLCQLGTQKKKFENEKTANQYSLNPLSLANNQCVCVASGCMFVN